ncbi:MAG TPA: MIP/aquaporin family protein, partial [Chthoniobacter sp.]|nr:MIP/aquaporin family protein [Chthoniobacter sp.]
YIVAQILGGVAGAALVYAVYRDSIQFFESQNGIARDGGDGSIGIFVTGPAGYFGDYWGPFLTEVVGTAFLLLFVFAVVDLMNLPPKANLAPVVIGLAVFAIGNSFGANSGYAINPARDLGPRLAHALLPIAGKGGSDWGYAWIPIVGPLVGALVGAFTYRLLFA